MRKISSQGKAKNAKAGQVCPAFDNQPLFYSLFSEGPDHKRSLFNACHRERKDFHFVRPERF